MNLSRALRWLSAAAALAVCLTPLRAQGVGATVVELTGQVSLLRDNNQVALFKGNTIRPRQVVLTGPDGYAKFQLPDNSTFEVFPNAQFAFRDGYPSLMDLVTVVLGRIRVHIDHSKGANPNRVSTPTAVISVRGTIFDVVVEDEDATTLVSVEEGVVGVAHRLQANSKELTLYTGDSVRVFRNQPLARQIDRSPIYRKVLDVARDTIYQVLLNRTNTGAGIPAGGPGGTTTSGDHGKGGSTSGGSSTPTGPGAPPAAPGAPPSAPGAPPNGK